MCVCVYVRVKCVTERERERKREREREREGGRYDSLKMSIHRVEYNKVFIHERMLKMLLKLIHSASKYLLCTITMW